MKCLYLLLLCFTLSLSLSAQKIVEGASGSYSFNISKEVKPPKIVEGASGSYSSNTSKEVKPPILTLVQGSRKFVEPSGNNAIDANESCSLILSIKNQGYGDGSDLVAKVNAIGSAQGLSFKNKSLPVLKVGEELMVKIPIQADINTLDGIVEFTIKIDEPNGFGSDPYTFKVPVKAFASPMLEVVDYTITSAMSGKLQKKRPFDLQILLQNVDYGEAEQVNVRLQIPENVLCLSANESIALDRMKPGAQKDIIYTLIVNDLYSASEIPISIEVKERFGKYSKNKTIELNLNQNMSVDKLEVEENPGSDSPGRIRRGVLRSDVDKDIPVIAQNNTHRYALIIGNEDYNSFQTGLSREVNVDYAENDARVFEIYAKNVLGIPEKQIQTLVNATYGQMSQGLAWINNLAKVESGQAELYFFYAGHGLPADQNNTPYLIPVDVSGQNVEQAIPLKKVYSQLTEYPSQKVTVFLDACFSGGARNEPLRSTRGVKVRPKKELITGNTVVFASSTGTEASGTYNEKQHGFFTYFLLKKLKESRGAVSYQELADYLKQQVSKESSLISKPQTPQVLVSEQVRSQWQAWRLN